MSNVKGFICLNDAWLFQGWADKYEESKDTIFIYQMVNTNFIVI